MKLPVVISLRNALPICAMPKGGLRREAVAAVLKFTNIPWAVSGLRKVRLASSCTGPRLVVSIWLNWRGSVSSPPQSGHAGSSNWSALQRWRHSLQSTSGSEKWSA